MDQQEFTPGRAALARLSVYLFGKPSIQCDGQSLPGLDGRKLQQLLSYLVIHRDRPQSREVLAGLFWGDHSTEQAKKYLRQGLWQLQSVLVGKDEPAGSRLLSVEAEWVALHSSAGVWLDVAAFEGAFTPVQDIPGRDLTDDEAQNVESAVQLYNGDLLEGWYDDWCLFERERLQNIYLAMLDKLMDYCEARKQYETGIGYGARILSFDRAREHTHRHLMSLQYLAGNRTAALRQYKRCVDALDEELGVSPAKSTQSLYEQIKGDRLEHFEMNTRGSIQPPESFGQLREIGELLTRVQDAAQHGLQEIDSVLKSRRPANMAQGDRNPDQYPRTTKIH